MLLRLHLPPFPPRLESVISTSAGEGVEYTHICVCVCVWDSEHNGWCRASDASHLLFETGLLIGLELHHIGSAPARLPASASV